MPVLENHKEKRHMVSYSNHVINTLISLKRYLGEEFEHVFEIERIGAK